VLDLCSSWISHLPARPAHLAVLGMNERELRANPMADAVVVHDLNRDPALPFGDGTFDAVTCTVSIDYLVRPIDVLREVARVLVAGGWCCCTFSNRCFPTKVIRGWLATSNEQHGDLVATYLRLAGGFLEPVVQRRTPPQHRGDPLWAVWARRASPAS
jgi:SAM-dependent methyltransferase